MQNRKYEVFYDVDTNKPVIVIRGEIDFEDAITIANQYFKSNKARLVAYKAKVYKHNDIEEVKYDIIAGANAVAVYREER